MLVAANVVSIWLCEPVSVTVPVPLPDTAAPPAEATVSVPCRTESVVVIEALPASTSLTERPVIDRLVSSATVCAPATTFIGASLTAVTLIVECCTPLRLLLLSSTEMVSEL